MPILIAFSPNVGYCYWYLLEIKLAGARAKYSYLLEMTCMLHKGRKVQGLLQLSEVWYLKQQSKNHELICNNLRIVFNYLLHNSSPSENEAFSLLIFNVQRISNQTLSLLTHSNSAN